MEEWTEAAKDKKRMNKEVLNIYGLPSGLPETSDSQTE